VLKPIPDNCTVVGVPGQIVMKDTASMQHDEELKKRHEADLEHDKLPDPVEDALEQMQKRIAQLEEQLKKLEEEKHE